jgi:hypothetical protein
LDGLEVVEEETKKNFGDSDMRDCQGWHLNTSEYHELNELKITRALTVEECKSFMFLPVHHQLPAIEINQGNLRRLDFRFSTPTILGFSLCESM